MKKKKQVPLGEFIKKYPAAALTGFFWRHPITEEFCVAVLAEAMQKRARRITVEEFRGATPEALIAKAAESFADIGTAEHIEELCESAAQWRWRKRRR